jgi:hypothetical protein
MTLQLFPPLAKQKHFLHVYTIRSGLIGNCRQHLVHEFSKLNKCQLAEAGGYVIYSLFFLLCVCVCVCVTIRSSCISNKCQLG